MKIYRLVLLLAAVAPASFAASREVLELQRDVANLTDMVRNLQKTVDEKLSSLQTLVSQSNDLVNRANTQMAVMQNNINDSIRRQQEGVSAPIASVGTKLDQMSDDFRNLRETVNDLNSRLGKLDQKIADLQSSVNLSAHPLPPPSSAPTSTPSSAPPTGSSAGTAAPPAGMSADQTYSDAYRDYLAGNYDLALQEFNTYVKYYNGTQFAPNAQFYVADIYYKKKDYENALQGFDAVLEHYADNPKTAGAHYWKGKTLAAMGRRDAAAREFREVLAKFPNSDVAPKAQAELRALGLSASPRSSARSTSSRRRRR